MNRKIEIVPDFMAQFDIYGEHFEVSPATDVIVRFVDPEYDFMRYLDAEKGAITLHWLGANALNQLVGIGIPETRQRLKMMECEHEEYLSYKSAYGLAELDQEFKDE